MMWEIIWKMLEASLILFLVIIIIFFTIIFVAIAIHFFVNSTYKFFKLVHNLNQRSKE